VTPGKSLTNACRFLQSRLNNVDLPTFGLPIIATIAMDSFLESEPAIETVSFDPQSQGSPDPFANIYIPLPQMNYKDWASRDEWHRNCARCFDFPTERGKNGASYQDLWQKSASTLRESPFWMESPAIRWQFHNTLRSECNSYPKEEIPHHIDMTGSKGLFLVNSDGVPAEAIF
jgi:hypothetical protein